MFASLSSKIFKDIKSFFFNESNIGSEIFLKKPVEFGLLISIPS